MPVIRFIGLPSLSGEQEAELIELCHRAVRGVPNLELTENLEKHVSVLISNDRLPGRQRPVIFVEVFGLLRKPRRQNNDRQLLCDQLIQFFETFASLHLSHIGETLVECNVEPFIESSHRAEVFGS